MSAGGSVMDDAKTTGRLWQGLCGDFRGCFTRPGWVRFTQWLTGVVFGWEGHTITQGQKPAWLGELARGHAGSTTSRCLETFDGGYAVASVVRPLLAGDARTPRVEVLTRQREDSRLYVPPEPPPKLRGRPGPGGGGWA